MRTKTYLAVFALVASLGLGCSPKADRPPANPPAAKVVAEEDCAAVKSWFGASETPAPATSEPAQGDDCAFYQRAWQQFLRATDGGPGTPRFVSYDTYSSVFGPDRPLGLMPGLSPKAFSAGSHRLVLAPRLVKSPQATGAEDIEQAGSSAILIDQNGHPIFYSIFLDPTFAAYVRAKRYNDLATLKAAPAEEELPVGIVEYKAAWQIVDAAKPPKDRIVVQALVPWLIADPAKPKKLIVDKSRPLRPVTVALIALHVAFLPENHPEMVWATFEYDRNAPSLKGNPISPGETAACLNQQEAKDETVADDGKPYVLYKNGVTFKEANAKPTALSVVDAQAQVFSPSTSIVRSFPFSACAPTSDEQAVTEIDPAISSLNLHVKAALSAKPWLASYSLVGAVWQDAPRSPDEAVKFKSDKGFPDGQLGGEDRLSSTSMESFTQTSSPNCFSCHDTRSKGSLDPKRISVSHVFRRFGLKH